MRCEQKGARCVSVRYLGKLLRLEQAIVVRVVMAEHEAHQIVLTSGIAVPVLHGGEAGVIVEQQVVLLKSVRDVKSRPSQAVESSEKANDSAATRARGSLLISGHARVALPPPPKPGTDVRACVDYGRERARNRRKCRRVLALSIS